jgi:hypothetical protein
MHPFGDVSVEACSGFWAFCRQTLVIVFRVLNFNMGWKSKKYSGSASGMELYRGAGQVKPDSFQKIQCNQG